MRKVVPSDIEVTIIAEILSQCIGGSALSQCADEMIRDRYYEAARKAIERVNSWEEGISRNNREEFLEAVRLGIGDRIPKINEGELYRVISQGVESGVRKFLKRG